MKSVSPLVMDNIEKLADECEALRADLEAVAVAAWNFTQKNDDGGLYGTALQEALDRPGVRKVLEGVKDG